jgi:hypothetical protein
MTGLTDSVPIPTYSQGSANYGIPEGATPLTGASGTVAAGTATATLTSAAGRMAYISGFLITSTGSTAAAVVAPTITGLTGGTFTMAYATVAGATLNNPSMLISFAQPIPASAVNTNIVVSVPSLGAGSTNSTVCAWGFLL